MAVSLSPREKPPTVKLYGWGHAAPALLPRPWPTSEALARMRLPVLPSTACELICVLEKCSYTDVLCLGHAFFLTGLLSVGRWL